MMSENNAGEKRRKLLKSIAAGTGAVVAGKSLPDQWVRPVVDSVVLPAHAQTSPPAVCTDLLRIEIQLGYSGDGSGPVLDDSGANDLDIFVATRQGGCEAPTYITAWGYYADAPSTPVYINTEVIWTTNDSAIAFLGIGPGVFPQNNSNVTGVAEGTTTLNASIFNFCGGIAGLPINSTTAAVTVNVAACP